MNAASFVMLKESAVITMVKLDERRYFRDKAYKITE